MLSLFRSVRARRSAEQLCRKLFPEEMIQGSAVCANEPSRFVVRVFCGQRTPTGQMLPPWAMCIIVAVDKTTLIAERVVEDEEYRPILR